MSFEASGGCHCGNIRYRLMSEVPIGDWAARYCSCGFCTRHGAQYASHPSATLVVSTKAGSKLGTYRFATASADFCFCSLCGVLTYLSSEIDGRTYGLVNVNTLDIKPESFKNAPSMSYAGEGIEERKARRRRNWIPRVEPG